ncbi:MAG: hypothetical protein JKY37_18160 [Nannocystaceae bacterium]|nr:hypothetical protein [Nannocystaceae bacterium]
MLRSYRRPPLLRRPPGFAWRARTFVAAAALAVGLSAAPSQADEGGTRGRIVKLQINTPGSEHHASFHGAITLRQGNGALRRYHWGGSACPGQKLSDSQIAMLAQAHFNRGRTWLAPFFVASEGGDKNCLVAFELTG